MCSIEDAEPWTLFHDEWRTAAKEHRCVECPRTIAKGERYKYATGLIDGSWYVYHTCGQCEKAKGWLMKVCHGYMYEMVRDETVEHWEEHWAYRCPAFGRLIVDWKKGWKRYSVDEVAELVRVSLEHVKAIELDLLRKEGEKHTAKGWQQVIPTLYEWSHPEYGTVKATSADGLRSRAYSAEARYKNELRHLAMLERIREQEGEATA